MKVTEEKNEKTTPAEEVKEEKPTSEVVEEQPEVIPEEEFHDEKTEKKKIKLKKKETKEESKSREIIADLKATIDELEQKSLRDKAELINYRKRKDEEVARMMKYCNEDLVKELLGVIDNFERAIDMDDDNLEDEVSKFLAGFKMIYCNLDQILTKFGVVEIEAKGKEFDPAFHQAVLTEHVDGVEPGMIIEVMQKGYMLKDKVIRPSMVKVSE